MGLRDELETVSREGNRITCTVCDYLDSADPEDAVALREALENPAFQATMIFRALANTGCDTVSVGSLRRHRRNECARR